MGNLAKDSSHNLTRPCLWKTRCKLHLVRSCYRTNDCPDMSDQNLPEGICGFNPLIESHVYINTLAFNIVRIADNGGLSNRLVADQCRFNFCRTEPVTGD